MAKKAAAATPAKTSAKSPRAGTAEARSKAFLNEDKTPATSFDFEVEEGLPIPELVGRATSAIELPFKDRFDRMAGKHGASFWLPDSYWTTPAPVGRGVDAEKATSTYIRNKVRTSFNGWKKKDEEARASHDILMVPRKKGDNNGKGGTFEEPGFTVFMLVSK